MRATASSLPPFVIPGGAGGTDTACSSNACLTCADYCFAGQNGPNGSSFQGPCTTFSFDNSNGNCLLGTGKLVNSFNATNATSIGGYILTCPNNT
jgi:hypothetical protein